MRALIVFLILTLVHAQMDVIERYVRSTYKSIEVELRNDPRRFQMYIILKNPSKTQDLISIMHPKNETNVTNSFMIYVLPIVNRPYKDRLITTSMDDLKIFIDNVLIGNLGRPTNLKIKELWYDETSKQDIPALMRK